MLPLHTWTLRHKTVDATGNVRGEFDHLTDRLQVHLEKSTVSSIDGPMFTATRLPQTILELYASYARPENVPVPR